MPEGKAEITAGVLACGPHGVDSHGISMIPRYDELRRKGRVAAFCATGCDMRPASDNPRAQLRG
jgi:LDH2 family malate/lactate/ureidoglycolate dehydrogenase